MTSFVFANGKIQSQRLRYHTPTTFRAQKRLCFTNPTPPNALAALNPPALNPPPPGVSPPHPSFSASPTPNYNSYRRFPAVSLQPHYILPWDTPGSKTASLYKISPPKLSYPAGSRDK